MAYIIQDGMITKSLKSPLQRASWDRLRDVLKLGMMGSRECQTLWDEYVRESPEIARLVVADVESDQELVVKADRFLDDVIYKVENPRKTRAKKARKAKMRKAAKATLTKGRKARERTVTPADLPTPDAYRDGLNREISNHAIYDADPRYRSWAFDAQMRWVTE